jgi:hypothetical protein
MLWSKVPIFKSLARFVCPVMELFHIYKMSLQVTWRDSCLFYPFIAPLEHSFFPEGGVRVKPHLKQIEIVFTSLAFVYPEFRERLLWLQDSITGPAKTHLRNFIFMMEFLIPVVSFLYILIVMQQILLEASSEIW